MKTKLLILLFLIPSLCGLAQVPKLNSDPAAPATVFLDFDGQYVQGTAWNWTGPISAQPSGLTADVINEIFTRVSEDYRIFTINITTDSTVYAAAPANRRIRVIVTPTYEWYGMVGGVSYVGSFTWGDETPAWVFSGLLGNSAKKIAEAISHESGHTLGLQHQSTYNGSCTKTAEYNPGQGTGETSWAPIMGVGYSKNSTTWYNGTSSYGCNVLQDDIATIASPTNSISLRSDEYGDNYTSATTVIALAGTINQQGIITTATDKDVFRFVLNSPNHLHLSVVPQHAGTANSGANMDIRLTLLDGSGNPIAVYNPADVLDASIDSNLVQGTYYVVVEGIANSNLTDYGSLGYYLMSGTLASILPDIDINLSLQNQPAQLQFSWTIKMDQLINSIELQVAEDGKNFRLLQHATELNGRYQQDYLPVQDSWYRIKVTTASAQTYYSNIVFKAADASGRKYLPVAGRQGLTLLSANNGQYRIYSSNGQLLRTGNLLPGSNLIPYDSGNAGLRVIQISTGKERPYSVKFIRP